MNIFKAIFLIIKENWNATLELNKVQQENRRVSHIRKVIKKYDKKIKAAQDKTKENSEE